MIAVLLAAPAMTAMAASSSASACRGAGAASYPTFCSIPPPPGDVRTPAQFHTAVLGVREAGAHVEEQVSPSTFSLSRTEGFVRAARRSAAPPPPIATAGPQTTEAFVKAMRAQAAPPRRPRHHGPKPPPR